MRKKKGGMYVVISWLIKDVDLVVLLGNGRDFEDLTNKRQRIKNRFHLIFVE